MQIKLSDSQLLGNESVNAYNECLNLGKEYQSTQKMKDKINAMEIAAIKAGKFPHTKYISHLSITVLETGANVALTLGGKGISVASKVLGATVQDVGKAGTYGAAQFSHYTTDYISDYSAHANAADYQQKLKALSVTALGEAEIYIKYANDHPDDLAALNAASAALNNEFLAGLIMTGEEQQKYDAYREQLNIKRQEAQNKAIQYGIVKVNNTVYTVGNEIKDAIAISEEVLNNSITEAKELIKANRSLIEENGVLLDQLVADAANKNKKLDAIEKLIENIPQQIKDYLEAMGVDLKNFMNVRFNALFMQNAQSLTMLTELVSYQRSQIEAQKEAAKQQTIHRGFSFLATIGKQFNIPQLYYGAVLASSSYTIIKSSASLTKNINALTNKYRNITNIVTNFDSLLACMDPMLAIGETVLTLVKMFQKSKSVDEILLEQLQKIITLLNGLDQKIESIAADLHQHLGYLLKQMQNMMQHQYDLSQRTITSIEMLQYEFSYMLNLMDLNFQSLFLQELSNVINFSQIFLDQDTNQIMQLPEYLKTMASLKQWLTVICKSPLLTGANIAKALAINKNHNQQNAEMRIMANIFQGVANSLDRLPFIMDILTKYPASLLNDYAEIQEEEHIALIKELAYKLNTQFSALPNVNVWIIALKSYIECLQLYPELTDYKFDHNNQHLLRAARDAQNMLDFVNFLQTTPELVNAIDNDLSILVYSIEQSYQSHVVQGTTQHLFRSLDEALECIEKILLTNDLMNTENTIVESAYHHKAKIDITGPNVHLDKFIDIVTNYLVVGGKKALLSLLYSKNIRPRPIYLLAQELGLGNFEVICYESVHANNGLIISMDGNRYGVEINFKAINGMRYQIYEASREPGPATWHVAHDNGPPLRNLFAQQVASRSKSVNSYQDAIFMEFVSHELNTMKKAKLMAFLQDMQHSQLLWRYQSTMAFYQLLTNIIGMPNEIRTKILHFLNQHGDFSQQMQHLLDNTHSHQVPITTSGQLLNVLELETIRMCLDNIITTAKTNHNFKIKYLNSPMHKQIYAGISLLQTYTLKQVTLSPASSENLFELNNVLMAMSEQKSNGSILHENTFKNITYIQFQQEIPNEFLADTLVIYSKEKIDQNQDLPIYYCHIRQQAHDMELFDSTINEPQFSNLSSSELGLQFRRKFISEHADGGYRLLEITREEAYNKLIHLVDQKRDELLLILQEVILSKGEDFVRYLEDTSLIPQNSEVRQLYNQFTKSVLNLNPDSGDHNIKLMKAFNNDAILKAYLKFDILQERMGTNWSHPIILAALAETLKIQLWILRANNKVSTKLTLDPACKRIESSSILSTKYLMNVNNNEFDLLAITGTTDESLLTNSSDSIETELSDTENLFYHDSLCLLSSAGLDLEYFHQRLLLDKNHPEFLRILNFVIQNGNNKTINAMNKKLIEIIEPKTAMLPNVDNNSDNQKATLTKEQRDMLLPQIYNACMYGKLDELDALVKAGIPLDVAHPYHQGSLLHAAITQNGTVSPWIYYDTQFISALCARLQREHILLKVLNRPLNIDLKTRESWVNKYNSRILDFDSYLGCTRSGTVIEILFYIQLYYTYTVYPEMLGQTASPAYHYNLQLATDALKYLDLAMSTFRDAIAEELVYFLTKVGFQILGAADNNYIVLSFTQLEAKELRASILDMLLSIRGNIAESTNLNIENDNNAVQNTTVKIEKNNLAKHLQQYLSITEVIESHEKKKLEQPIIKDEKIDRASMIKMITAQYEKLGLGKLFEGNQIIFTSALDHCVLEKKECVVTFSSCDPRINAKGNTNTFEQFLMSNTKLTINGQNLTDNSYKDPIFQAYHKLQTIGFFDVPQGYNICVSPRPAPIEIAVKTIDSLKIRQKGILVKMPHNTLPNPHSSSQLRMVNFCHEPLSVMQVQTGELIKSPIVESLIRDQPIIQSLQQCGFFRLPHSGRLVFAASKEPVVLKEKTVKLTGKLVVAQNKQEFRSIGDTLIDDIVVLDNADQNNSI